MGTAKKNKETPLMKQYNAVKTKYPGALLLFRVGDFYETFGQDAVEASRILGIVLTKRANGAASSVELAGFPHHSLDNYLPKLVRAGKRVAVCDQLEDPKEAKGIVKRGVTELVTPGVSINDNILEAKQNNWLASVHFGKSGFGIAFADISTGEFLIAEGNNNHISNLLQRFLPSEILFSRQRKKDFFETFGSEFNTYMPEDWVFTPDYAKETLTKHFGTATLKGFGIDHLKDGITAAGAVLFYLAETKHRDIKHISSLSRLEEERYVWLDKFTVRNLELLYPQQEGGVPLIEILDRTVTPMGARLMKNRLALPLKDKKEIDTRLDGVECLIADRDAAENLLGYLEKIGDLQRLMSKIAVGRINPREMRRLGEALKAVGPVKELLSKIKNGKTSLKSAADGLDPCQSLFEKIETELVEDPPLLVNRGGIFCKGINEELDELRSIAYSGKDYLAQIQKTEAERTGISSLKIAYNKVFGYYLEVTNAHKDKVPEEWIRKQTLVNAERYITEELKEYEEKILHAEEKINIIEQRLFEELVLAAGAFLAPIRKNAEILADIDCLLSFAEVAVKNRYVKPTITEGKSIDIKGGRHPVIERQLPPEETYVPNDIYLDEETRQIMIITGPNMAGKSALLRQTALIVLMAQAGSFVPAQSAELGLTDKIFTRVGASDNLSKGESTFMVEMTETASILHNLSDRSLVLLDEIGRGTSTYDGISVAWSVVEYIHDHPKFRAKTLFATHYHELNELADRLSRVENFKVSVKEAGNKVIFTRKLAPGGSEHSFGIHVAQMAGMPNAVVLRADEVMRLLEKDKVKDDTKKILKDIPERMQLSLFEPADPRFEETKSLLEEIDINTMSPVEALLKLNEIKQLMNKIGQSEENTVENLKS